MPLGFFGSADKSKVERGLKWHTSETKNISDRALKRSRPGRKCCNFCSSKKPNLWLASTGFVAIRNFQWRATAGPSFFSVTLLLILTLWLFFRWKFSKTCSIFFYKASLLVSQWMVKINRTHLAWSNKRLFKIKTLERQETGRLLKWRHPTNQSTRSGDSSLLKWDQRIFLFEQKERKDILKAITF